MGFEALRGDLAVGQPGEAVAVDVLDMLGSASCALAVPLGVRFPEKREDGHQIIMWSDVLGGGLPVDHEDHAGGEDVVGHDPTVGVVGRPGAVVMQDVGQQGEGRLFGFVGGSHAAGARATAAADGS